MASRSHLDSKLVVLQKALEKPSPSDMSTLKETIQDLIRTLEINPHNLGFFEDLEDVMKEKSVRAREIQRYLQELGNVAAVCANLEMSRVERETLRLRCIRSLLQEQQSLERAGKEILHQAEIEAARKNAEVARYQAEEARYRQEIVSEEAIERTQQIAAAKHRVELAKYHAEEAKHKREARDAMREPAPPPPPPPTQEEIRAQHRQRIQDRIEQLRRDEALDIDKITHGKPQEEWPDEVWDEFKQIQNMYAMKREKKREEMEKYL